VNTEFLDHLTKLQAPIFTAPPGSGNGEFRRPDNWQSLTPDSNGVRLAAWHPGHALGGVMGGMVAVIDVDTKNGGDPDRTRQALDALNIRIYADVLTPSGGRHYYVAGHPDLPTVHATAGRDGLTGHPGVEIISFGANVFLPGTQRPKYDGAGYVVLDDNLEILADGGDPEGAESLAFWVSDNRARQTPSQAPSALWDGAPPDARQAAYLATVLDRQAAQVACMGPNSGRNVALYTAALICGSFIAGAGMDEQAVVDRLREAADRCGLTDEDGPRSVAASIASGLKNGKKNPRAVPDADGNPLIASAAGAADEGPTIEGMVTTAEPVEPIKLDQAHEVFRRWLGEDYDLDALDAVLAAAAVERLDGDPLWLLLISGSGNAKTETVQALDGIGATVTSTITSSGALLSATSARERSKTATGGLLRKMGGRGVFVIKDVTSILSMNRDARAEVLGAMREVYDGRYSRNVGTDGGQTLDWTGRLVMVGAVTTAWDRAHDVIASMGDRFVLLRMDSTTGRQLAGRKAIGNTGSEVTMRAELAEAVAGVMVTVGTVPTDPTYEETEVLLAAADLVTLARTGVEVDYRGDVIDAHAPEMPTRFAKQLTQVLRGGVAIGMPREDALRLAIRCARDSMPPLRLAIIDDLREHPGQWTPTDVRKRLDKPRATVDRQLQALHALGIVHLYEGGDRPPRPATGADEVVLLDRRGHRRHGARPGV
jgi:hypothetical protein